MIGTMELTACPAPAAHDRCDRARRLGQVKFVVLTLEGGPESVPAAETLSHAPDSPYRRLRAYLSRVMGRLVAARP